MDASNYAAPNTPIASSKRPRIAAKNIKSPVQAMRLNPNTPDRNEGKEYTRKLTPKKGDTSKPPLHTASSMVPPTPSKNLFSPGLRTDVHVVGAKRNDRSDSNDSKCEETTATISQNSDESSNNQKQSESSSVDAGRGAEAEEEGDEEEDVEEVFNPYFFIGGLPNHNFTKIKGKVCLPAINHSESGTLTQKTTLVLDLDETLVHCTVEPIEKADLVFPVAFNGNVYQVYVRKRPYLDYFLETVSKSFEVVVFTASQKVYADVLLDQIDPERKFIHHRLFREACLLVQGNYLKDLTVIQREMHRMVLVDNSPHAYGYQVDNGVPIESWYDDENDTELLKLIGFLKRVNGAEDVRPIIREHFKTHQLIANAKAGLPPVLTAPPF